MTLRQISLLSIAICLAGLVILTGLILHGAWRINNIRDAISSVLEVQDRIDDFTTASNNLVLMGADPHLWQAYIDSGEDLREELKSLGLENPDALKSARRIKSLIQAVESGLKATNTSQNKIWPYSEDTTIQNSLPSQILINQVFGLGVALDTALDEALHLRQQTFIESAIQLAVVLTLAMMLYAAMCILAFSLIHRKISVPAKAITNVLDSISRGDRSARAVVVGDDEMSLLASSLNHALDDLEELRDQLLRAQEVANIGSWDINLWTGRQSWSSQVFNIFGLSENEFGGDTKHFFALIHPDDRTRFLEEYEKWSKNGGEISEQIRIVRTDGSVRWVSARAKIIKGKDGIPAFSTGTLQDITHSKQMDYALKQTQELIQGSEDLYGIIDHTFQDVWMNRSYERYFNITCDSAESSFIYNYVTEADFDYLLKPRLEQCLAGESQRFEWTHQSEQYGLRRLLVRCYLISDVYHEKPLIGIVITDVTQERHAEENIKRQASLLDMAGRIARFGAWSFDVIEDSVEWSDVVSEIHGMPPGYCPTREKALTFVASEFRNDIQENIEKCVTEGIPFDTEMQIVDTNGLRHWVHALGEAVRNSQGDVVRVQGALQDISIGKELEHEHQRLTDQLAAMIDSITDGFFTVDNKWNIIYANRYGAKMLEQSPDSLLGSSVTEALKIIEGSEVADKLRVAMYDRKSITFEQYFESFDRWFEITAYSQDIGIAFFIRDVSDRHKMIQQLKDKEDELRISRDALSDLLDLRQALVNSLPAHIALLDSTGVIVDVNQRWRQFGLDNNYAGSQFGIGTNYLELCKLASGPDSGEAATVAAGLQEVLDGTSDGFELEYPCHSPTEKSWFRVMCSQLPRNDFSSAGAVVMHIDVTERKNAELELIRLAYEDQMTGVLSRNGFESLMAERFDQCGWMTGVVVMIDVINLHDVNEAHGYEIGDALLSHLSQRLQATISEAGLVGRIGGDEFVIFDIIKDEMEVKTLLDLLEKASTEPFEIKAVNARLEIGIRMGYTLLGNSVRSSEKLIREAELALFEHRKDSSVETFRHVYTSKLESQTRDRIKLTRELRNALDCDEFELHFQPKINLSDGRMMAAEALIRWRHPERGLLLPGSFISVAEQSQLIGPIGDWAIRAACRELSNWQRDGVDLVRVAVNVSQVQFQLGDFPSKVKTALNSFDVSGEHLTLEITESVFENNSERLVTEIKELKNLGIRLSLDDFGTGYSSLSYLQKYPFDEIKIDGGFVQRMLTDNYSRNIVLAVLNMARALKADVVAEGIESKEIAEALIELNCPYGQGFYYSMALEAEDFRWLLEQRKALPYR